MGNQSGEAPTNQYFDIDGRIETGVAQFGHQPRGFFLRGKHAIEVAQLLEMAEGPNKSYMRRWAQRLRSAWVGTVPSIYHLEKDCG